MLVLMLRTEGSLMVGDDVEVKVLGIEGGRVRVGVKAPKRTPVHRREVWLRIKAEEASDQRRSGQTTRRRMA